MRDDAEFRAWFDATSVAALSRTITSIPDGELLPALHALLIRYGARLNQEGRLVDDAQAKRSYGNLRRRHGRKATASLVQQSVCAIIDEMREVHAELPKP